jgi:hypothetical protein
MSMYRVLRPLTTGHKPGDLVSGARFQHLDALIRVGALAEVRPPPLSELPEWTTRAETLASYGIITVTDFLEADDETLKKAFNYKTTRTIDKWREEIKNWITWRPNKKKQG